MPTLTQQDFVDLLNVTNPIVSFIAQQKFQDWIGARFWYDLCQCTTVSTPAAPAPAAPPAGVPVITPVPSSPLPCFTHTWPDITFDPPTPPSTTNGIVFDPTIYARPTTGNNATLTIERYQLGTGIAGVNASFGIDIRSSTGTVQQSLSANITTAGLQTVTQNLIINATGPQIRMNASASPNTDSDHYRFKLDIYCGGQTGPASPCCPPDAIAQGQLDLILQYVKLIQRQAVPFAYVAGTVHTGLTGSGTLSVSGLLGVKVDITTTPTPLGRTGSSPVTLFDAGYLTWGTADGYPQSEVLQHDPQLSLPARASAFTSLAYDLHPGVVVDITELVREP